MQNGGKQWLISTPFNFAILCIFVYLHLRGRLLTGGKGKKGGRERGQSGTALISPHIEPWYTVMSNEQWQTGQTHSTECNNRLYEISLDNQ